MRERRHKGQSIRAVMRAGRSQSLWFLRVVSQPTLRSWQRLCVFAIVLMLPIAGVFCPGCAVGRTASIRLTSHPPEPLLPLAVGKPRGLSERTQHFLRRYNLSALWQDEDPRTFLRRVQEIMHRDPSDDKVFAAAEIAYLSARKAQAKDPELALDLYGAAVIHAFQYLFDDQFRDARNPYDPQFRGACELYNASLEGLLRLVCQGAGLQPGRNYTVQTASGQWRLRCEIRAGLWRSEEFGRFEFVSDYEIRNLRNHYRNYGLGVPLIAIRRPLEQEPPVARFYPDGLTIPVTVFLRPHFDHDPFASDLFRQRSGTLELYDPLVTSDVRVGNLWVPLQTDLTTPLAYLLADERLALSSFVGLFRPEQLLRLEPRRGKPLMGLYMLQPYERGKIPVVMIHGLWSSPLTWVEMFNELRSLPEIRQHFQFWFFWYPTAQPFWITAATLRDELAEVRQVLDPYHQDWTLDQMVLVGHSMGGLLARLQTVESGDRFWRLISDQPFEQVRADPTVQQRMKRVLFFRPSPSVARVIYIATPHRGSRASNITTQWILERLIRLPEFVVQAHSEFYRANRELIRDPRLLRIDTSVEALDPNSPFFQALEACPKASWVKWHSIVGVLPEKGLVGKLAAGSDGVVSYRSAHVDEVESELVVPADHLTIHTHPLAIQEVRRILLEHLAEVQSRPRPTIPADFVHKGAPTSPVRNQFVNSDFVYSLGVVTPEALSGISSQVVSAAHMAQVAVPQGLTIVPGHLPGGGDVGWLPLEEPLFPVVGPFSPISGGQVAPAVFPPFPAAQGEPNLQPLTPGIPWAVGPDVLRR